MTGSAEDGPESQRHIGNKKQRRDLANQFEDAKDQFKIVNYSRPGLLAPTLTLCGNRCVVTTW